MTAALLAAHGHHHTAWTKPTAGTWVICAVFALYVFRGGKKGRK